MAGAAGRSDHRCAPPLEVALQAMGSSFGNRIVASCGGGAGVPATTIAAAAAAGIAAHASSCVFSRNHAGGATEAAAAGGGEALLIGRTAHHCDGAEALQGRRIRYTGSGGHGTGDVASQAHGGASRHQPGRAPELICDAGRVRVCGSGRGASTTQEASGATTAGAGTVVTPATAAGAGEEKLTGAY